MRAERVRAEDLEVTMVEYGSATIVTFDATHEGSVLEITSLGGDERRRLAGLLRTMAGFLDEDDD